MKNCIKPALFAGLTILSLSIGNLRAQQGPPPGGNFDPQQMRQMMMDRYREMLEVKSDDEWKLIQTRIEKVNEARRNIGFGPFGMRGGFRGGPGGPGGPGGFNAPANPEMDALQKAIDDKASTEVIKTKLAAFREARKAKQAALAKAQSELKEGLSVKQEAAAVLAGLIE